MSAAGTAQITVREPDPAQAQIGVLIFTYPPDFSLAARAIRGVRLSWHRTGLARAPKFFWCVHKRHMADAQTFLDKEWERTVPAETPRPELIDHEFDAGGHLQCLSAVAGMKHVYWRMFFSEEAKAWGLHALIKLDSDVILLRPEQWTRPWAESRADYVAIPQAPCPQRTSEELPLAADGSERAVYTHFGCGACYLLSSYAAAVIGGFPAEAFKKIAFRNYGAEDRVFGRVLIETPGVICSEISPKDFIGKSFEREPGPRTSLILDNPKDNFGKRRYSWELEEFSARGKEAQP